MAKRNIPLQSQLWNSDEEFELLLQQSLSAIQPPADFSRRVMAAVHQEAAAKAASPEPTKVIPFAQVKQAKKRRFGIWPGAGAIAAGLVLFWAAFGMTGDDATGTMPLQTAPGIQVAELENQPLSKPQRLNPEDRQTPAEQQPVVNQPDELTGPEEQTGTEALVTTTTEPVNVSEPGEFTGPGELTGLGESTQPGELTGPGESNQPGELTGSGEFTGPGESNQSGELTGPAQLTQPGGSTEPEGNVLPEDANESESGAGELILPRAAFGTEAQGTLSVRLLAEVPNSQIYTPAINRRGSAASFYTVDEENVYSWRVNLSTADSPEVTLVTSRSSIDDIGSLLAKTAEPCDATTLVASPDNTIMAQNSTTGLWISLAEGEVYSLTEEAGGSLLAWSPDSSKLLFTNSQGQLFIGYPLEKRLYQITDMSVEDVCWSTDNQTIIFLAQNNGQSALYVAELI